MTSLQEAQQQVKDAQDLLKEAQSNLDKTIKKNQEDDVTTKLKTIFKWTGLSISVVKRRFDKYKVKIELNHQSKYLMTSSDFQELAKAGIIVTEFGERYDVIGVKQNGFDEFHTIFGFTVEKIQ